MDRSPGISYASAYVSPKFAISCYSLKDYLLRNYKEHCKGGVSPQARLIHDAFDAAIKVLNYSDCV
jgi:hypothetical protein